MLGYKYLAVNIIFNLPDKNIWAIRIFWVIQIILNIPDKTYLYIQFFK